MKRVIHHEAQGAPRVETQGHDVDPFLLQALTYLSERTGAVLKTQGYLRSNRHGGSLLQVSRGGLVCWSADECPHERPGTSDKIK